MGVLPECLKWLNNAVVQWQEKVKLQKVDLCNVSSNPTVTHWRELLLNINSENNKRVFMVGSFIISSDYVWNWNLWKPNLPMISLQIATKTDKMYNCIYKLFFVMHLKIANKNLPQKITTLSIDSCNGQ